MSKEASMKSVVRFVRKVAGVCFCSTLFWIAPGVTLAAPPIDAHVLYAGTYGDGTLFIYFSGSINESGCPAAEIRVDRNSASLKSWLAIALTAAATGTTVRVQTDGCYMSRPTLSTIGSYLFLWAP
jgi:hypothetical protein